MSTVQHYILATAGHVDHGKSALVKALTGTDPDRLPEEKSRGITIELGFAHLELPSPTLPGVSFRIGIVDVPGHEDFVKNMVAGVGAIDVALLVVASDDGWMPQTEEHLQILTYFGVQRGVVALTKADLVQDEAAVVRDIRERLHGSLFAEAPIVPTSTVSGRGLDELKAAVARILADTPPPRDIAKPRLPVDRVFTLPGVGTVVTGTLSGGTFRKGQPASIQPSGKPTRIRRIQSHGRDVDQSGPGTRTALNVADVDAVEGVHRGDVVTLPELGRASEVLDVLLHISPRASHHVKDGVRVRAHHGSGNVAARVALMAKEELTPGSRAIAQLRLEMPAFVFAGDRFTIRDWAEQRTLAGAIVLEPDADRRAFRRPARVKWLEQVSTSIDDVNELVALHAERDGAVSRVRLLQKSNFSQMEVDAAVERLAKEGRLIAVGEFVVLAERWKALAVKSAEMIDAAHRAHPEHLGLPLGDLRRGLEDDMPLDELFEPLVNSVCERGFVRAGSLIRRTAHRATLPQPLQAAGAAVSRALSAKPLEPPSRKEVAPDEATQRALRYMLDTGEVVDVSAELVMMADAVSRATAVVETFIREHGAATVSDLRQALGSSRRIVVPLLEYLDRAFVTVRQGDRRALRRGAAAKPGRREL